LGGFTPDSPTDNELKKRKEDGKAVRHTGEVQGRGIWRDPLCGMGRGGLSTVTGLKSHVALREKVKNENKARSIKKGIHFGARSP